MPVTKALSGYNLSLGQSWLRHVYFVRHASTDKKDPLAAYKLVAKTSNLVEKSTKEEPKEVQISDNRGLIARTFNFPAKTPALEDQIPDILSDKNHHVAEYASFYNNLIIYDFAKLPPVKHGQLKNVFAEYHGITSKEFSDDFVWLPFFRMPRILAIRIIGRIKLFLSATASYFCSRDLLAYLSSDLDTDLLPATLLSTISLGSLIFIGNNMRKLVVQTYASEDLKYLRICRFSFFSRRRDIIVPVECVRPLTETNPTMRMPFYKLEFIRPENPDLDNDYHEFYDEKLWICAILGGMRDREMFEAVFGKLLRNKVGA